MEIQLAHVIKNYGTTEILHDVSLTLSVGGGAVLGLIGPNGAGKSTLMRLLSGITTINGGQLTIDDSESHNYTRWAQRHTVYVPAGDRGLRNKLTLLENLQYFSALRCERFANVRQRFLDNIKLFDAEALINKEFDQMSTGQKKKATLLVAISLEPSLILLDEPSNGLDMLAQVELMQLIKTVAQQSGKTIILSSHDPVLMSGVTTQYVFINGGRFIQTIDHTLSEAELRETYDQLFQKGAVS